MPSNDGRRVVEYLLGYLANLLLLVIICGNEIINFRDLLLNFIVYNIVFGVIAYARRRKETKYE